MTTALGVLAVILALSAAAYWYATRRSKAPAVSSVPEKRVMTASAGGRFAAVEIRVGSPACDAAKALAGESLLASEAPVLPLAECTQPRCGCAFQKLTDRRQDHRRWTDHGVEPPLFGAAEKRQQPGRRQSDGHKPR